MVSLIIPCKFIDQEIYEMTKQCLDSVWQDGIQLILIAGDSYTVNVNNALRASTGDVIVIGNNDLIFPKNWLEGLLKVLDEGFDIATCWTSDQQVELDDVIREGTNFGALFAMNREVYETIGGFDEQFKGYFADTDYRIRLLDTGFRIGMNHGLVVEHEAKATYKKSDPRDDEYLTSMRLFEAKHGFVL